ncbi:SH3-like domain-containing protein [cf. Phormidesmis sp. LEGE 11477]|uniref:SH3-like domain-containing protein n=1 Tax=cf. Phormidesmis sp. LEGE 11477 TaxID=1828680 RepID=UPI001880CE73|nr:nitrile hydratase subunit beta [cf. Phormidesmis sp. LEGE 11477]
MAIETSNECMSAEAARAILDNGLNCRVNCDIPPQFQVGELVRAKVTHPKTYTRLPRYVRGKVGNIMKDYGVYVFPDTVGQRLSTKPQHVYSVRFAAQEVWGKEASANDALYVDLFDDHLEKV